MLRAPACRYRPNTVTELLVEGKVVGTLFVRNPLPEPEVSTKVAARAARTASRQLQALGQSGRAAILRAMAAALLEHKERILAANAVDVELAAASDMSDAMRARLVRLGCRVRVVATRQRDVSAPTHMCNAHSHAMSSGAE